MGKSAILSRWLDLQEQRGRRVPHHFLRRDVMDWDRPETVVRSLAAQIEELCPDRTPSLICGYAERVVYALQSR